MLKKVIFAQDPTKESQKGEGKRRTGKERGTKESI